MGTGVGAASLGEVRGSGWFAAVSGAPGKSLLELGALSEAGTPGREPGPVRGGRPVDGDVVWGGPGARAGSLLRVSEGGTWETPGQDTEPRTPRENTAQAAEAVRTGADSGQTGTDSGWAGQLGVPGVRWG